MKKLFVPIVLSASLLLAQGVARGDDETRVADMNGENERPPVHTDGWGCAEFTLNEKMDTLTYFGEFGDLTGELTVITIHVGDADGVGPVIFILRDVPIGTSGMFSGTLTEDDFIPRDDVPTFEDAINAFLECRTYINIHSRRFPGGEIRGQLVAPEPPDEPSPLAFVEYDAVGHGGGEAVAQIAEVAILTRLV